MESYQINSLGDQFWKDADGEPHRTDGPAIIYKSGEMLWYKHGKLHREGGPAVIYPNHEYKRWLLNGQLHRTDGPAIDYPDTKCWYVNNKEYSYEEWKAICNPFIGLVINTSKSKTKPSIFVI